MQTIKCGQKPTGTGGPRTLGGKSRSRINSRKHGIFSSVLTLSDTEKKEFEDLEETLRKDLRPCRPLLEVLFDDVVIWAWHLKMAHRNLQFEANRYFKVAEIRTNPEVPIDTESLTGFPFELSRFQLVNRLKFADQLREIALRESRIPARFEGPTCQAFGVDFWKSLTDWEVPSPTAIQLIKHITHKFQLFNWDPPGEPVSPEEKERFLTADLFSRQRMIVKLIDSLRQILLLALHHVGHAEHNQVAMEGSGRLDLILRYQVTARRNFYHALGEFERRKRKPS